MLESFLRGGSKACGACMVTASHLPKEWNGLKLFSAKEQRGLNKKEVKEVLGLAADLADMMECRAVSSRHRVWRGGTRRLSTHG